MVDRIKIYQTDSTDPYLNIATEKYLLETVEKGCCILYLWQNQNTVVIGRNQNPWVECRTSLLEEEDGHLARRLSGGGAVFHDLGNLNFTFIMCDEDYDVDRQLSVIQTACADLGITAERSGRNDLLADGQKFSGNAFYHSKGKAYHHGTLLINADMEKLSRYLTPSKAKLEAKGVASVRSRVVNLSQLSPGLTCNDMALHMRNAFSKVYKLPVFDINLSPADSAVIEESAKHLGSWDWLYGPRLPFSFACEDRFFWGSIRLELQVQSGIVQDTRVYTDAMDWQLAEQLQQALTGCRFNLPELLAALPDIPEVSSDVAGLLRKQEL